MTFRFRSAPLAIALIFASAASAQQFPAGARDAADTSQTEAANTRLRAASAALEAGDYARALPLLRTLASEHPKDAHILYDLGFTQEHLATGDSGTEAAGSYTAALEADPGFTEARLALGLLEARAGHLPVAHEHLTRVAQSSGAAPELRARAFRALAQIDAADHPDAAREDILAAIRLSGETPEDTSLSASLAARAGDTSGAEVAFRRALAAHPDDADAASGLAHLLLAANRPAEAEQVLRPALAAHPADTRILSQAAAAAAAQGRTPEAIAQLEKLRATRGQVSYAALDRQLARLYALNNQNPEAEKLFAAAIAAAPGDPTAQDDLATILVREARYPEAERLLLAAVAERDKFPSPEAFGDAAGHLAFAASKAGHPEVCLRALSLRATVLPNSAPSLFLQATAYDNLHQYRQAQNSYRAFLGLAGGKFPDQEFQARHRLVALEHMK